MQYNAEQIHYNLYKHEKALKMQTALSTHLCKLERNSHIQKILFTNICHVTLMHDSYITVYGNRTFYIR